MARKASREGRPDEAGPAFSPVEIRAIRERLGYNFADMAAEFNVEERAVRYWEDGERTPGGPALLKLAELKARADRMAAEAPSREQGAESPPAGPAGEPPAPPEADFPALPPPPLPAPGLPRRAEPIRAARKSKFAGRSVIGDKIRRMLAERDMTQVELGRVADISPSLLNKMMAGERGIDLHQALRVARVLDVPFEFLADDQIPADADYWITGNEEHRRILDLVSRVRVGYEDLWLYVQAVRAIGAQAVSRRLWGPPSA
jgi:transcriptional regulator with XRE-family HTH domain